MVVAIVWNAVFVAFQSVFQYVLAYFSEVEVEVAAFKIWVFGIEERVQKPELYIFDVALFEVCVVHTAHYAAPAFFRIEQSSFVVDICAVKVVRAALGGIVGEVKGLYGGRFSVCLLTSGIYFASVDFAHVWIGKLFEVAFYVARDKRRIALCEHSVDVIPVQQRTVFSVVHIVAERSFRKQSFLSLLPWSGCELPGIWRAKVYACLCRFEVVDIA